MFSSIGILFLIIYRWYSETYILIYVMWREIRIPPEKSRFCTSRVTSHSRGPINGFKSRKVAENTRKIDVYVSKIHSSHRKSLFYCFFNASTFTSLLKQTNTFRNPCIRLNVQQTTNGFSIIIIILYDTNNTH